MEVSSLSIVRQAQSALVLANAADIIASVVSQIAGNDISNSINGSKATSEIIKNLAVQRIAKNLEQRTKAAN